jgi:hypothetical protein
MPTFDKSQCPPGTPDEVLQLVNLVIDKLRARLGHQINLPEPPTGIRVLNLVRGYLQAHLRRLLTFLDGGYDEYHAGRPLMTELATRAIYENVATLCDFTDKLKPLCDALNIESIEQHVSKAAFVTRIPSFLEKHGEDARAPNILNQIDKMDKRYTNFREAYDHLSDLVHPNGLGAVVYFSTIKDGVMSFVNDAVNPERAIHSLFIAALLLGFVEVEITDVETRLSKLNATIAIT